jgi:hypothetical protein
LYVIHPNTTRPSGIFFSKNPNCPIPFPFEFFFQKPIFMGTFPYEKWRFSGWRYRLHPGVAAGNTALKTAAR